MDLHYNIISIFIWDKRITHFQSLKRKWRSSTDYMGLVILKNEILYHIFSIHSGENIGSYISCFISNDNEILKLKVGTPERLNSPTVINFSFNEYLKHYILHDVLFFWTCNPSLFAPFLCFLMFYTGVFIIYWQYEQSNLTHLTGEHRVSH